MREPIVRTAFYRVSAALAALILVAGAVPSIAAAKTVEIKMTDTPPKFMPLTVTIEKGDTVEWINNAQSLHSVTTNPAVAQDPKDVSAPTGAKAVRLGLHAAGGEVELYVHRPGHLQVPLPAARKGPHGRRRGGQIKSAKSPPRALPGGGG